MNGSKTCVMAMITPARLKISGSGASTRPRSISVELIRPLFCRRMNQAAVLTRSDVHSGSIAGQVDGGQHVAVGIGRGRLADGEPEALLRPARIDGLHVDIRDFAGFP